MTTYTVIADPMALNTDGTLWTVSVVDYDGNEVDGWDLPTDDDGDRNDDDALGLTARGWRRTGVYINNMASVERSQDALVLALLNAKNAGFDCDDNGSAEIMAYFDRHDIDTDTHANRVAFAFPLERDQWQFEHDMGLRDI